MATQNRPLYDIAADIRNKWAKVNYAAEPYLEAMESLNSVNDSYYYDSGKEIVLRFLVNASGWRGEDAKAVKAELRAMVK